MSSTILVTEFKWREFVCGWGAAFVNVSVTYPINKLIFRQMLHGINTQNAFNQLKTEGLFYLYRGILPPLYQRTLSLSLMFGVYEQVSRPLIDLKVNPYLAKAMGAMASGTAEAILMPFERVQTLLSNAKYHKDLKNTVHAFNVLKPYGLAEYYRGLTAILCRNGPSNVGFFIIREELMQNRLPVFDNEFLKTSCEFLCGALIGVVLSGLFYPCTLVKIAQQNKIGGEFEKPIAVLMRLYRERGSKVRNLYHGMTMNSTRAFISWGVMTTAYEHNKGHYLLSNLIFFTHF